MKLKEILSDRSVTKRKIYVLETNEDDVFVIKGHYICKVPPSFMKYYDSFKEKEASWAYFRRRINYVLTEDKGVKWNYLTNDYKESLQIREAYADGEKIL